MPSVLEGLVKGLGVAGRVVGKNGQRLIAPSISAMKMQRHASLLNLGLPMGIALLTGRTPGEKLKGVAEAGLLGMLTAGLGPGRQILATTILSAGPILRMGTHGMANGYRHALDLRTSAAIPFSHSSAPMDHAFATMQYAQARMNGGYSSVGREAAFFAARYTSRG